MASAINKSKDGQETNKFMENLSKEFFSKLFVNSIISIEPKPKAGKQGGHIVVIDSNETSSISSASSMNITHQKFYVKPQDQFVLTSSSLSSSKLCDVEELFVYKFLCHINKGPSVFFYVNQQKPDCLLIATADANSTSGDKFYTAACTPAADLKLIKIEQLLEIRIIEVIFILNDLFSNKNNYGWLCKSKNTLIVDFSINKDESIKANPTPASRMIMDNLSNLNFFILGQANW